jgi:CrcB protein
MNIVYLIIGGSLGTIARYYATGWVDDLAGPRALGVFAVNIVGSFIIGLFLTLSEDRFLWPPELRLLIAVGFLGAFTTFSTLTWETLQLVEMRDVAGAMLNLVASTVVGMVAVYLGVVVARAL